jgi:hypothetical protein
MKKYQSISLAAVGEPGSKPREFLIRAITRQTIGRITFHPDLRAFVFCGVLEADGRSARIQAHEAQDIARALFDLNKAV